MSDLRISVRLDKEMRRRLDGEVKATGQSESELVRQALAAYFKERAGAESCFELARRNRLIGCGKQLPPDLSTNPKHFEGFGK